MVDVRCTDDCRLGVLNRATLFMLKTIFEQAQPLPIDALYLTAGTNGQHSGPNDPHYRGDALDVRTHNFPTRQSKFQFCDALQTALSKTFYCFVEDPDTDNEHIHVQVAKGKTYPTAPLNGGAPRTV